MKKLHIIVVGAGPVGVVAALACAQKGMAVTLLEAEATVDESQRAATTHPATLEMIDELGVIGQFIGQGLVARYVQFWDRPTRTMVAEFDHNVLCDETDFPFVVQTEQHKLAKIGIARIRQIAHAKVCFNSRVSSVQQDDTGVTVTIQDLLGDGADLRGDYLIAADGGRSMIRHALEIEFEGYTWPERFLVVAIRNDFQQMMGCCYRNYVSDPEEWVNLFKIAGDDGRGLWRTVFPTRPDETDEHILGDEAIHNRLQRLFSIQEPYDVVHRNLYKVHQRVAARFRVGRVFLAGDSAHVNNTIGGLGLNCGIHDAMELADTLHQVAIGHMDDSVLDRYERRRRAINVEFVQQATVANKKRLEERDQKARQAHFENLRATAADNKKQKEFLMRSSLIESVRKARLIP